MLDGLDAKTWIQIIITVATGAAVIGAIRVQVRALKDWLKAVDGNVGELNKSIHNGLTSRTVRTEAKVDEIVHDLKDLKVLPDRMTKIEARCEARHGRNQDN